MSIVLTDLGALQILKKYFANVLPIGGNDLTLKLFVNDVQPADNGTTYTEATGGGYVAKTLAPLDCTPSIIGVNPNAIAQVAYPLQTFTFTGTLTTNLTIYGYYITDADGVVIYAERATASFTPANSGDALLLTPIFKMSAGTPT